MFRDNNKRAIFRLIAILAFCGSAVVFSLGLYDYGRGSQRLVESVPVCEAESCLILPARAAGKLMDIFDNRYTAKGNAENSNTLWLGMATNNLCLLPEKYLSQYKAGEDLVQVNNVFAAIGLVDITRDKDRWLIKPGRAVDSISDRLRKMADPFFADYSCYKPYLRFYNFLILGLFWVGLYALRKAKALLDQPSK